MTLLTKIVRSEPDIFRAARAGFLLLLILICASVNLHAQTDSTRTRTVVPDSNMAVIDTSQSDLEAPVYYDAQHIDNFLLTRMTTLTKTAVVKYQSIQIEAGKITIDLKTRSLVAEAIPETLRVAADSLQKGAEGDSLQIKMVQYPVLIDGGERIVGDRMEYNFDTRKGRVVRGRTDMEGGKYGGRQIKRISEKVLNISHGTFSTCDKDEPHFKFLARRMKIIAKERIIAKPIVFYIGEIPMAVLPFATFPTQSGRRSGLIVPRYGKSATEGRNLRDLGYYWAINDYMDARVTVDFYEKAGWLFRGAYNYNWLYHFRGGITGSLTRKNFSDTGTKTRRWDLGINHNQQINKATNFSVSGRFISDNSFYKDFTTNQRQRLTRDLNSQANFSRRWDAVSLTLNATHNKDLGTGDVSLTFPRLRLSFKEWKPFARKTGAQRGRSSGSRSSSSTSQKTSLFENLSIRYSMNTQSQYQSRTATVIDTIGVATDTASALLDTASVVNETRNSTAAHKIAITMSAPGKLFGILGLSQSLSLDEDWFDRTAVYEDSTLTRSTLRGFSRRQTFRYQANMNTKLYGLFQPGFAGITAVRHVMTPNVSLVYTPDFSDPKWGYFQEVENAEGEIVRKDRFAAVSGTPRGETAGLNFSVSNLFQMKRMAGGEEKKLNLFNLNFASSYNFAAETKKLGRLSSSFSANPSKMLSINASASFSPYVYDTVNNVELDRYLYKKNGISSFSFYRMTNLSIRSGLRLKGKSDGQAGDGSNNFYDDDIREAQRIGASGEDVSSGSKGIPWRLNLSFSYSLTQTDPDKKRKNAYMRITNAEVSLTENWRIRFSGNYDFLQNQLVQSNWTIYRDLHCWEASVNWTPSGSGRGFYFRLGIKASELQDIKLEKRTGRSNVFGGGFSNFR